MKRYKFIKDRTASPNEVFENQVARVDEIGKHENTGISQQPFQQLR